MEAGILGLVLFILVMINMISTIEVGFEERGVLWGLSMVFIIVCSIGIGYLLTVKEPIKQYETKQEWKPRLQINNINNKQDTIYLYNLNDTNKIK